MKTTKITGNVFTFMLLALLTVAHSLEAQKSETGKDTAKMYLTKNLVDSQSFVFIPQFVSPLRGISRPLTSYYSLSVSKDSIVSYLPYFGRAYSASLNSTDMGFDFTSTTFVYRVTPAKKDSWNVVIKAQDKTNVPEFSLRIFSNSSASLNITSLNRDPITYSGYIKAKK